MRRDDPHCGRSPRHRGIRSDAAARDISVIVYSAEFHEETVRQAQSLGAKEYLVKGMVAWPDVCRTIQRYAA